MTNAATLYNCFRCRKQNSQLRLVMAGLVPVVLFFQAPDAKAQESVAAARSLPSNPEAGTAPWTAEAVPDSAFPGDQAMPRSGWDASIVKNARADQMVPTPPLIQFPKPVAPPSAPAPAMTSQVVANPNPQPHAGAAKTGKDSPGEQQSKNGAHNENADTSVNSAKPPSQHGTGVEMQEGGAEKKVTSRGIAPAIPSTVVEEGNEEAGKTSPKEMAKSGTGVVKASAEKTASGTGEENPKAVQSYCVNISNPALDARYLRQKKQLEDLRADIQARTAGLEGKISDFKDWLRKREEFANKARDSLVSIYASMKSEAAAKQIAELDEETASSLLSKLDSRQSSAILSEMDAKKAAKLMQIVSGASKIPGGKAGSKPGSDAALSPASSEGGSAAPENGSVTQ